MRITSMFATVAAAGLLSATAHAQTTAGGGASVSTPQGSVAGGASAGTMSQGQKKRHDRAQQRQQRAEGSSSSTYGAGSIYTDRNRATGGVSAGGTATGAGPTSSSTAVNAYGSTDRNGSTGEVYGDSAADAGQTPPKH
ncbi:hypothetical protein [Sphingomonas jeddahensis]|uniref:Uncharacterized protein n=1 Tax=Sphingomonas jeddahensis TaxID=1915074 RepID=A0A1V2ES85_9SPHN|nr:hypothetical protein [Sphingomonas jeddahensis]ONF95044.1 hypothetical protein SPHI_27460 [Sphingomonas jeddahensis]